MGFRNPQALVVPSLRSGYYSSAFRFLNPIDTSKTVSNYYIDTTQPKKRPVGQPGKSVLELADVILPDLFGYLQRPLDVIIITFRLCTLNSSLCFAQYNCASGCVSITHRVFFGSSLTEVACVVVITSLSSV